MRSTFPSFPFSLSPYTHILYRLCLNSALRKTLLTSHHRYFLLRLSGWAELSCKQKCKASRERFRPSSVLDRKGSRYSFKTPFHTIEQTHGMSGNILICMWRTEQHTAVLLVHSGEEVRRECNIHTILVQLVPGPAKLPW